MNGAGLQTDVDFRLRFIAALLTKPFVILTGLSGSGKTKLAQAFAYWICEDVSQIAIVPVGADWINREPLLGYPNALEPGSYCRPENGALDLVLEAGKGSNAHKPYFLILDEMNLSHVERYFADFLSAMESKEAIPLHAPVEDWKDNTPPGAVFPPNLFIIGTVNIDETTYMFSPKVLDRAQVIEFRVSHAEMDGFLDGGHTLQLEALKHAGASFGPGFVQVSTADVASTPQRDGMKPILLEFFDRLQSSGAEFGFRTAAEIYRFADLMNLIAGERAAVLDLNAILDAAILQKLLPKVHGSRRKLEPVLRKLASLCLNEPNNIDLVLTPAWDITTLLGVRYPLSLTKIAGMGQRVVQNGFTSFAEA